MSITGFQRLVLSVTSILIAIRVFFPEDVSTTLFHVVGMLVLGTTVFVLLPSPNFRRVLRFLAFAGLLVAGLTLVVLVIASVDFARSQSNLKNLATALASYYVDNNGYPYYLTDLVPTYIKIMPKDPCTNNAFNYALPPLRTIVTDRPMGGLAELLRIPGVNPPTYINPPTYGIPQNTYTLTTPSWSRTLCGIFANSLSYTPREGLVQH